METSEARLRVRDLGPIKLEVGGVTVRLAPYTSRLLARLVAAEGQAVAVRRLYRDVWARDFDVPHQEQRNRNEVQKRVLELRRALDRAGAGTGRRLLQTDQVATAGGPETTYRLALGPDELDSARFTALVNGALHAPSADAVRRLTEALELFRGRPLAESGGEADGAIAAGEAPADPDPARGSGPRAEAEDFAGALRRRLTGLRVTAQRELIRRHRELGRIDLALPLAERLADERPADRDAAMVLAELREWLRTEHADELLRCALPGLRAEIVLVRGDLFEQKDANLVVGFTDTFDTATGEDFVINAKSVQGQLVERLFGGQVKVLDEKLRGGLRQVDPVSTESVRDKQRGKRTRYPVGTVVPLAVDGRRVFATAYSRLSNDLVARSGPADLRRSLELLWPSVATYGMYKPVAIPLVGSGLARIVELRREELVIMIVQTFVAACRRDPTTAPELRIVLLQEELGKTGLAQIERYLSGLGRGDAGYGPDTVAA
ncbi:MAG TPA: macro domain-containing protein [Actinocrinis sp.]|nr:macro domain-containing protein [Actinocrinis sp.]